MDTVNISKEDFMAYEDVRQSGVVNMLSNDVRELAGINKSQHAYIIEHYGELKSKYMEVQND